MNANQFINSKVGGYLALGLLGAAVLYYISKKAGGAVAAVGSAINPTSDKNIFYGGVNAVGSSLTGDSSWTLGGSIYDYTHLDSGAGKGTGGFDWASLMPTVWAGRELGGSLTDFDIQKSLGDWKNIDFDYINPASNKNIVYSGVSKVGSAVTGDSSWSLGSWLYDVFNPSPVAAKSEWDNDYKMIQYSNGEGIN